MRLKRFGFALVAILALARISGVFLFAADVINLHNAIAIFHRRELSEAKRQFEQLLTAEPANAEARLYLGRIALEEERFTEGLEQIEKAARLSPTNAVYFLWLARGYALHARKAGVPGGLGPALKSKAAFEKAIALDPQLIEARDDLIQFHREAPGIVGGSRRAARAQANEIKKRDAYIGSLVQGDLLMDEKKFREAATVYRSALEMKPEKADAYYRLGSLYLKTKEFDKAFSAFEKILQMNTNEVEARFYLGETGALSGQRLSTAEEALKIYLKAQRWSFMPSLAEAHFRLGQIYEWKGDRELTRAEFQAALKLEPDYKAAKAALRKLK